MGDRVAVMRDGRLEQVDTPQRLYEQPTNMFVAGFIGSPAMNLLRGGRRRRGRAARRPAAARCGPKFRGDVVVGVRPEALSPAGEDDEDVLEMPVVLSEMLGSDVLLHLDAPTPSALTADMLDAEELVDDACALHRARAAVRASRAGRARARCASTWRACTCSTPSTEYVILR